MFLSSSLLLLQLPCFPEVRKETRGACREIEGGGAVVSKHKIKSDLCFLRFECHPHVNGTKQTLSELELNNEHDGSVPP